MLNIKVSIRPLKIEDAEAVQRYASDELVARTTNIPQPYPKDGGESFVKKGVEGWKRRDQFQFAILVDNEMIGNVALVSPDMEKYTIQCDYAISSSHWGKGITTMAVGLAVTYAFRDLEMQTINSACLERNPASSRVLEKNGFIETEKFLYNNYKFKDEPAYWFQLTREKWIKRNSERDSTPERR